MIRKHPRTGEVFEPHVFKDGFYRMADPAHGSTKHHAKDQIRVGTLEEVRNLLGKGFSLRMRGKVTRQVNLIKPEEIEL
ncbi:hypothetical protein GE300_11295 [Rhodobacteraceae bacterium 2CG4]|uniref:Uncharacterized protein n=1 Tax=Halovulum marinum TaxID=2662447 RepID=A0A6L5Z0V7_9RHOB|nr:hypothetical protein [Halovulum marinum]